VPERPLAPDSSRCSGDRRRGHDERIPSVSVHQICQRRDHHPVPPTQARPRVRPRQHRALVTEHQDLSFALARIIRRSAAKRGGRSNRRRRAPPDYTEPLATRRNDGFRSLQVTISFLIARLLPVGMSTYASSHHEREGAAFGPLPLVGDARRSSRRAAPGRSRGACTARTAAPPRCGRGRSRSRPRRRP
jgi:hypothetical protein